jgi:hypothetical protein
MEEPQGVCHPGPTDNPAESVVVTKWIVSDVQKVRNSQMIVLLCIVTLVFLFIWGMTDRWCE